MKIFFMAIFLTTPLYAGDYTLHCKGWGEQQFELTGELEESGSSYIDAFIDLKIIDSGKVIYDKKHIDTTGIFQLSRLDGVQVYLAELRPIQINEFQFLSIAANHPRPSGNSYLIFNQKQYLAECSLY